jgi:Zn-finger nucleic acid-binding protein
MECPVCRVELQLAERQGIEIDYCPKCRGVWLDRGELDKIIERAHLNLGYAEPQPGQKRKNDYPDGELPYDYDDYDRERRPERRRKSFLDDMFDIFD